MISPSVSTPTIQERMVQIIQSTDELIRRLENWIGSPDDNPVMPADVQLAIEISVQVCESGDIPQRCRELATIAIPKLFEASRAYEAGEHGAKQPNGSPGPKFWAAAKAVKLARLGSEAQLFSRREPVATLRKQGVTDYQIAAHIYGNRGVGPFMTAEGGPDVALLDQESATPYSVIPQDWIPDWEKSAFEDRKKKLANSLSVYDKLREGTKYEDPESIEDLLRSKAFIQQIQKVKHATRAEILQVARTIGVEAIDGPGYVPSIEDYSPVPQSENPVDQSRQTIPDELKDAAIKIYTASNGSKGAAEIASELRSNGHEAATTRSIAAYLTQYRRHSTTQDQAENPIEE